LSQQLNLTPPLNKKPDDSTSQNNAEDKDKDKYVLHAEKYDPLAHYRIPSSNNVVDFSL